MIQGLLTIGVIEDYSVPAMRFSRVHGNDNSIRGSLECVLIGHVLESWLLVDEPHSISRCTHINHSGPRVLENKNSQSEIENDSLLFGRQLQTE